MPQLPTSAGWTAKEELHAVLDTLQSLSADHADSPLVGGRVAATKQSIRSKHV